MEKDYEGWAKEQKKLEAKVVNIIFYEREIWWCALGTNLGFEMDGKHELRTRPVLIVKTFNRHFLWVVPLTSKPKKGPFITKLRIRARPHTWS